MRFILLSSSLIRFVARKFEAQTPNTHTQTKHIMQTMPYLKSAKFSLDRVHFLSSALNNWNERATKRYYTLAQNAIFPRAFHTIFFFFYLLLLYFVLFKLFGISTLLLIVWMQWMYLLVLVCCNFPGCNDPMGSTNNEIATASCCRCSMFDADDDHYAWWFTAVSSLTSLSLFMPFFFLFLSACRETENSAKQNI